MIRVVIADDHTLLRQGLAQALTSLPDIDVVGSAANGEELLQVVDEVRPDVVLVDLEMPKMGGLESLRRLSGPASIVVTMHADPDSRDAARRAGAVGFLSKSAPLPDLAASVRAAAAGEDLLSGAAPAVLERYRQAQLDPGAAELTARERELLGLLASGISRTEELADRMFISQKTVKNHLASIYGKLGVSDRAQAAVEAIRLGIRRPRESK